MFTMALKLLCFMVLASSACQATTCGVRVVDGECTRIEETFACSIVILAYVQPFDNDAIYL